MKYEARIMNGYSDDDWIEYEAYDAEDAALQAGKAYDAEDHPLLNDSVYVLVREVGSTEVVLCYASAESDIHYSSGECRNPIECNWCKKDCREQIINGVDLYYDRFCGKECYESWRADYMTKYIDKAPTPPAENKGE